MIPFMLILSISAASSGSRCSHAERDFFDLSYEAPRRWPYPPWRIVLETEPGTCNLYGSKQICKDFSAGVHYEPEFMVRDAIASLLLDCSRKTCYTIDIGMSTGYFTAAMASLGAHVTSIERSKDMVAAFEKTRVVNCWEDRVTLINGAVGLDVEAGQKMTIGDRDTGRPLSNGWGDRFLHGAVPFIDFRQLLRRSIGATIDFIKMDIDSIEALLLEELLYALDAKEVRVTSIVMESNLGSIGKRTMTMERLHEVLSAMQFRHGYDVYILDTHSHALYGGQRVYNNNGMNVGARYDAWKPPASLTEHEHVRAMRHVMKADKLPPQEWKRILPFKSSVNILLTQENLLEERPTNIHPVDFLALHKRYNLSEEMHYKFPRCGMHPQSRQVIPC